MEEKFRQIKEKYDVFERELLKKGSLVMKETDLGFWATTHLPSAFEFFKKMKLGKFKNFIDLGSGDGRVALLASLFGLKAFGIEYDPKLSDIALLVKNRLALPEFDKVHLRNDDFHSVDISNFQVVFVHPDQPFYRGLEAKLMRELNGILIVANWEFLPLRLKMLSSDVIQGEKYSVYQRFS